MELFTNKVVIGEKTIVDLTNDTVTPEVLRLGYTAHSADGKPIIGTYNPSGGGGSPLSVASATSTPVQSSSSIRFTGLLGEPTSFVVIAKANIATSGAPYTAASVVFDGSTVFGQYITNTYGSNMSYSANEFSKQYTTGVLTITASTTNFQAGQYELIYTYGGSSSNIKTANVQVGPGVTQISFTNLPAEPKYFSCVFKSNFDTSNGYARAHAVARFGNEIFGLYMNTLSNASDTSWTSTYSNGTLTINSVSTANGGYFHQPGYYQLTYAVETSDGGGGGESGQEPTLITKLITSNGTYNASDDNADGYSQVVVENTVRTQNKEATPTKQEQVVQCDIGYDGLGSVTVHPIPSNYIITSDATAEASDIANGKTAYVNGQKVVGTYTEPESMNVQAYHGMAASRQTSYTDVGVSLTVAKSGTYKVSWMGARNTTSGTSGSQLYINNSAYGSATTTFTNSYGQSVVLNNVSLTQGQVVSVRARARSTSYYMMVGNLVIEQTA